MQPHEQSLLLLDKGCPGSSCESVLEPAYPKMYVVEYRPEGWVIQHAWDAFVGYRPGRKRVEGDHRTPEGVYLLDFPRYEANPRTGGVSMLLSYPNPRDLSTTAAGHPGCGVTVHGGLGGSTDGCLRIADPDADLGAVHVTAIRELAKRIVEQEQTLVLVSVPRLRADCKGPPGSVVGVSCAATYRWVHQQLSAFFLERKMGLWPSTHDLIEQLD